MFRLTLPLLLAGCAASLPSGPAPKLALPRAVTVQLAVNGTHREDFESHVDWILKDNGLFHRVTMGGDAHVTVDANLERYVMILGGTDLTLAVRVHGENVETSRTWSRAGMTSGVPSAIEEMTSEAAKWALERAVASAVSAPSTATESATPSSAYDAPPPSQVQPAPVDGELPTPIPAPTRKPKRHRQR